MTELWRDIPGYEGHYQVSNHGNVRSTPGKVTYSPFHGFRKWKCRVLKPKNRLGRDYHVTLWRDGKPKSFYIHRLVGLAFIPNPYNKPTINHKDGDPHNNHVSNLEWATYKENNDHAVANGLINTSMRVTAYDAINDAKLVFQSLSKAGAYFGVSRHTIRRYIKHAKPFRGLVLTGE